MNIAFTRKILTTVTLASAICLLALYAGSTSADERQKLGVGVSTNGNSVYFPMRFDGVMVEPMYYHYDNEYRNSDTNGFYEQDKTVVLGVGVFSLNPVSDDSKAEVYWGIRFGYLSGYRDRTNTLDSRQDDESGVIYEPTLGVQYFFTSRFSVSADASFTFQRGTVDVNENGNSYSYDHNYSRTNGKVILRGYFN